MKAPIRHLYTVFALLALGALPAQADTDKLTTADGWTKINALPTADDIANNYYVFVDDTRDLMLGVAKGANQNTKWYSLGVYYQNSVEPTSADINGKTWMLESYKTGFAMRNLEYSVSPFQTEWNASWKFDTNDVYATPNEWTQVNLSYQPDGYWTLQNGKYPDSGYIGPWNENNFANGAECAANKTGNNIGHFQIYAISRNRFRQNLLKSASESNPVDVTPWYVSNATFDANNRSGWTEEGSGGNNNTSIGCEIWHRSNFKIYQNITVPNGKYRVSLQIAGTEGAGQVYGTGSVCGNSIAATATTATATSSAAAKSNFQNTVLAMIQDRTFGKVTTGDIEVGNGTMEIGMKCETTDQWLVFDNFKLYCTGIDQTAYDRAELLAALERFENSYNLADGTDYSRQTMSAEAWTTLIEKVNAASQALDDATQSDNYTAVKDELVGQMDATDTSLRLFKSYKAMADGTCSLCGNSIAATATTDTDTDASEQEAITALNNAFAGYALAQDASIDMAAFLGENLDFSAAEGSTLNNDNSNNIHAVSGWEVDYADADAWASLLTHQSGNDGQLYMRKNWGSAATTLTATKQKMLPVGKYALSFSWNSDMKNMSNLSHYKLGETTVALGKATSGAETLEYEFEVTGEAQPFDLVFGFKKTGTGNTPAQIVVDNVVLTYTQPTVTLANDADNATAIADNDGYLCNVTLSGRTLFKDGSWNTLCLPFDMTAEQVAAQLAPAALMELDTEESASYEHPTGIDGNTLYLNFKNATAISAGRPYIIKWNAAESSEWTNPTFRAVTIASKAADNIESADGSVSFQGIYAPADLAKGDKSNLYLGDGNALCWPEDEGFKVNAFHAYFKLNAAATQARQFVMNFGNEATGIREIADSKPANTNCYDLQGRKIADSKLHKGLYINNGKKIIVK